MLVWIRFSICGVIYQGMSAFSMVFIGVLEMGLTFRVGDRMRSGG